ncbi:DinB family protein [Blastococcus sp. TF02A-30]|uniref:DinB family protein n=1 Tax=Blastococcus sp. TF02A-30 TaxID=2250580 RepID=UPI000DEAD8FA|nr:DinB family protein [Blastococcus sp. TF02A-30]RBY87677.1 DinB family protein [Blastococcus sp. TF02A-30]
MPQHHERTAAFRGATFAVADLAGATFRDCDLSGARIVSSWVDGLRVDGFDGSAGRVLVDDVDVSGFVRDELDRRHPERVQLRAVRTAEDHRAMWATLEQLWDATVARARQLPEELRQERVDGEWSVAETLRHLVFAVDSWIGKVVDGAAAPWHPLGLPPTDFSEEERARVGSGDARPSFEEAEAAHADRRAQVRRVLDGLTEARLDEVRTATPAPAGEPEPIPVRHALAVVLNEHCEHRRYAVRDLAVLEARDGHRQPLPRTPECG